MILTFYKLQTNNINKKFILKRKISADSIIIVFQSICCGQPNKKSFYLSNLLSIQLYSSIYLISLYLTLYFVAKFSFEYLLSQDKPSLLLVYTSIR